jgi:hypothetical protein
MNIINDKMTVRNEEPQILSLQQSQIPAAAKMMAATFFPDPLSCYLIPNDRDRLGILEKVWSKTIKQDFPLGDRKSTRLNSSHQCGLLVSRLPSSA